MKDTIILDKIVKSVDGGSVHYDLEFKSGLTLISGKSGVGRTTLYNMFADLAVIDDKIIALNYRCRKKWIDDTLLHEKLSGKLIVIDNADVILTMEHRNAIKFDFDNQYIIFGRNTKKIMRGTISLADMIRVDDKITLDYFMLH